MAIAGAALLPSYSFAAAKPASKPTAPPAAAAGVETWPIRDNVYLLVNAGANITVQIGDHAVILVNAGRAEMSEQVLSAVKKLTDLPIEYIIDTNADADVVGGNLVIKRSGSVNTGQPGEPKGAGIISQLNTLDRITLLNSEARARDPKVTPIAPPTDTFEEQWAFFNGEAVMLYHAPNAHTDGDTYVFFRRSDVIATGDLFNTDRYPAIDEEHGGSLAGILDALADFLAMMVPRQNEEGGTYLVPGRGRICDRTELTNYHDALSIIQGRIRYYVSKGMTLEQVRQAKPSFDYDGLYGSEEAPWSTRGFIDAVYREESRLKNGGATAAGKSGEGSDEMKIQSTAARRAGTVLGGLCLCVLAYQASAQRGPPPGPPLKPKQAALIDLTGYWVAQLGEDWRWRMMTPAIGETTGIPVNPAGTQFAKAWDPKRGHRRACRVSCVRSRWFDALAGASAHFLGR